MAVAAVLALAAGACGSSSKTTTGSSTTAKGSSGGGSAVSGGPAAGSNSPSAAVVGFLEGLASKSPSACNFVVPANQAKCKTAVSQIALTTPNGPVHIGKTVTSGNEALVVVVGNLCLSATGSGSSGGGTSGSSGSGTSSTTSGGSGQGSSGQGGSGKSAAAVLPAANSGSSGSSGSSGNSGGKQCLSNTDPSKGLPSGSTTFAQAFAAAQNSNTNPATREMRVNGKWYVDASFS